ncbi:hypothetical protein C7W93_12180 [Glaciimonas sp. PCH181]|nr:hypothetical protein C7W93_12180 [Glaciimonas sp. PCH181]
MRLFAELVCLRGSKQNGCGGVMVDTAGLKSVLPHQFKPYFIYFLLHMTCHLYADIYARRRVIDRSSGAPR